MTEHELDGLLSSRELPTLPADRLKQIETAVTADLTPVKPLAPAGVYLAGFAGIFLGIWVIGCVIAGQRGWRALSELQKLGVLAPLGACVALLVFSIVRQMTPAGKQARSTAAFSVASFALLLLTMAVVFRPAYESAFVHSGLVCFRTGMAFAIPAAMLFALLLRRGAGLSPALTGATAGGLAGLVGLAVLEIHCPNLNVYHIMVWHVSVTLACMIGGLILSSVTFRRWRSNS